MSQVNKYNVLLIMEKVTFVRSAAARNKHVGHWELIQLDSIGMNTIIALLFQLRSVRPHSRKLCPQEKSAFHHSLACKR